MPHARQVTKVGKAAKPNVRKVKKVVKTKKIIDWVGRKIAKTKAKGSSKAEDTDLNTWTKQEEAVLRKLKTPQAIQEFLDTLAYDEREGYYSVRSTIHTRKAHCMGGAFLAAYCLERAGLGPPRIVGIEAVNDDAHAIAVYQKDGYWGAVAKSNFTLIRSRCPVYRSLRELMMSYYDFYFNTRCTFSMTGYSGPFNPNHTGNVWKFADVEFDFMKAYQIIEDKEIENEILVRPYGIRKATLGRASKHLLRAGLLGSNPKGLYKPS